MVPACRQAGSTVTNIEKMYYIYIIQSEKDGCYYTGLTSDLKRRLCEHNKSDTKTTRSKKPRKLVYSEKFDSRFAAREREKFLKSGVGREFRTKILCRGSSVVERCPEKAGVGSSILPLGTT